MQKHQRRAESKQSVLHNYHDDDDDDDDDDDNDDDDNDDGYINENGNDDQHFSKDYDILKRKVNVEEQDLRTQKLVTDLALVQAQAKGSPMAGRGWRTPSRTTSTSSRTSRTRLTRMKTTTLHLITQLAKKLKTTRTRITDVLVRTQSKFYISPQISS